MSENEYVATAAAEKRLREVLTDRLPGATESNVDDLALVLLDGAKIEYKARAKQVVISLDLPDVAATRKPKGAEVAPEGVTAETEPHDVHAGTPEIVQGPHIAPFQPKQYGADADFEDVHYD